MHGSRFVWPLLALACANSAEEGLLVPRTVVEDEELPRFALSDGRLVHLQTFGDPDAPVVVMLHGGPGGDHRDYLPLEALSDTFFVVLWDQRGTGLSERVPDEELDGPTYLADLAHVVDTFSPDRRVMLIGHSWGGAYATYYAQSYPERVDRMVLVEPGALDGDAARRANVAPVDLGDRELQEVINTTDYLLPDGDARADYFYVIALAGFRHGEPLLGYDFWRLGYRANLGINTWQGNFDRSYSFDFTSGIEQFTGDVLFVTGEAGGRLGHDFQTELHLPHFPQADVLHLPDIAHGDLLRHPDTIARVRTFLGGAR
jgi:proline iminopeptidase